MSYVQGEDRGQAALLPAAIEDYVAAAAPVRVTEAIVALSRRTGKADILRSALPYPGAFACSVSVQKLLPAKMLIIARWQRRLAGVSPAALIRLF